MAITSLLVANRGEIARRVLRTARGMGLRTVAVYSDADRRAPYVNEADVAVALGGPRSDESYLDSTRILDAAKHAGADAVHPGYGFLSENAAFAEACAAAGLTFVGATPEAIRAMGAKIEAKRLAGEAGVPTLDSVEIGEDPDASAEAVAGLGFPVLLKPSAGGGGMGMQVVRGPGELTSAMQTAARIARSTFGEGALFAERFLASPRHVEVQVFGAQHSSLVHLFERECSIQRRHQKIIEEAPSPAIGEPLRRRLTDAALAVAKAIGYRGAGTVEFLVDGRDFFFLEMNTRLQVEHAVTEEITGLDLVRLQLRVAAGEPLGLTQEDVARQGHAIEARLYAEDPAAGFLPAPGTLEHYAHGSDPGVRFDDGVVSGSEISPYYDPMIAKVIAWAATREEATDRLIRALRGAEVHGLTTNRDFLVAILSDADFRAARTTVDLVERRPELAAPRPDEALERFHAVAAVLVAQHRHRREDRVLGFAPSGWRNLPSQDQRVVLGTPLRDFAIGYRVGRDGHCGVRVDGHDAGAWIAGVTWNAIDLESDGLRRHSTVRIDGDRHWVNSAEGQTLFVQRPRFPSPDAQAVAGDPTAPVPGMVVAVEVRAGDPVSPGDPLVVLEAMKMEHRIEAATRAVVEEVLVHPGQNVDAHQVLIVLRDTEGTPERGPVPGGSW